MTTRTWFMAGFAATMLGSATVKAAEVQVVASFSILGDMVSRVGGDRVSVTTLVGPNGDAHEYQPTPIDIQKVATARVLVFNGLGLEGWMTRLQGSANFHGTVVTASKGVKPQQMEDEDAPKGKQRKVSDPHAWQNLANGRVYVRNIQEGLTAADPGGQDVYQSNAARLIAEIDALEPDVYRAIQAIPPERRKIITTHDAFGYFATAYGMQFIAPQGISTESEPTARDMAKIIRQIKVGKIPAVFVENISSSRLLDQIGRESGAKIGGKLFSDALSEPDGPAPNYVAMFRHNVDTLRNALASDK